MLVKLVDEPFDPWVELSDYSKHSTRTDIGACAVFVGTMRNFNEGISVKSMTLEHYPGMTEKQLEVIIHKQTATHQLLDALVVHRVGLIHPGEPIVLTAAWSNHRKQAFEACRNIMEILKHSAPFWKQEQTDQGSRWVTENTLG